MPRYRVLEDQPGQRLVLGTRRPALAFDRSGVALAWGWLGTLRLSRAMITRVQLRVTPRHELALSIRFATRWGTREESVTFSVRDLDLDTEALDLAFRIARVLGFEGFAVRAERVIELLPRGPVADSPYRSAVGPSVRSIDELAGATLAVPAFVAPTAYATERPRFVEPATPIGDVTAGETIAGVRVGLWQPSRIELATVRTVATARLVWNALVGLRKLLVAIVAAVVAGGAFEGCRRWTAEGLAQPGSSFQGWKDYVAFGFVVLVLVALFAVAIALVVAIGRVGVSLFRRVRTDLRYLGDRRVSYDGKRLAIHGRGPRISLAASDLRGVLLRSHADVLDDKQQWSELFVATPDDEVLVLVAPPSAPRTQAELERVAIGLARTLDVPYEIARPT